MYIKYVYQYDSIMYMQLENILSKYVRLPVRISKSSLTRSKCVMY